MTRLKFVASVLIGCAVALGVSGTLAADDKANWAAELRFRKKLNAEAEVNASQESIRSILVKLLTAHGLPFAFDEVALKEGNIALEETIDFAAKGVTLRSILNQLLTSRELVWDVQDGRFQITTNLQQSERMVVRSYPTRSVAKTDDELSVLAAALVRVAAPESWEFLGGTGSFRLLRGALTVRQSTNVHAEIAKVLRELAGDGERTPDDLPEIYGIEETTIVSEERILAALNTLVDVDFQQLDMKDCLKRLRELSPVTIWCGQEVLEGPVFEKVTISMKGATLESVLNQLFSGAEIECRIADEGVLIDSKEPEFTTRTYVVKDIASRLISKYSEANGIGDLEEGIVPGGFFGRTGGVDPLGGDFSPFGKRSVSRPGARAPSKKKKTTVGLADLLQVAVSPSDWETLGGEGVVERFRDRLIVRQTVANHRQIAGLLADLRQLAKEAKSPPASAKAVKNPRPERNPIRPKSGAKQ